MLRLALLGDPVSHSLSPRFQNAALAALGIEGSYEAIRCTGDELEARLAKLAEGGYRGVNLTVPLKERAFALLAPRAADVAESVRRTGAVNTLRLDEDGRWSLHNTDPEGFTAAAELLLRGSLAGRRVLVLGAGGAARAVVHACLAAAAAEVGLWNRSADRRDALIAGFGAFAADGASPRPVTLERGRCPGGYDLIVQSTSLGLAEDDPLPPLPAEGEKPRALDLITHATPWRLRCAELGCESADGREMLLGQGAAAFRVWTGREAPLAAMRAALS